MALDTVVQCPLCLDKIPSLKDYQRHVGRHQEELALFALPKRTADDEAESDLQDNCEESANSIGTGLLEQENNSELSSSHSLLDARKDTQDERVSTDRESSKQSSEDVTWDNQGHIHPKASEDQVHSSKRGNGYRFSEWCRGERAPGRRDGHSPK